MNSCYLMMTNRCNMNCSYCYEREFFKDNLKDISEETAKRAIDFLVENHKKGNKARPNEDINICYFGGEPTLNWEVLKKNIVYARSLEKEKCLKCPYAMRYHALRNKPSVGAFRLQPGVWSG